jgi:hypothetical protein
MHHSSPCVFLVQNEQAEREWLVAWEEAGASTRYAHANLDDATRDGAYLLAIAAVEAELNLFTVERATTRTGCDFYVSPQQAPEDLEEAWRLEVSGTNQGKVLDVRARLKEKIEQTGRVTAVLPAMACVVGFEARSIMIEKAKAEGEGE